MKDVLSVDVLFPILLLVVGSFMLVWLCYWLLRKQKLLLVPYGGMEWSLILFVGGVILGILLICTSFVEPIFQTYKTYKSQQPRFGSLAMECFKKFSQFFLVVMVVVVIYMITILLVLKLFPGQKLAQKELQHGNLSVSIMMTAIAIGFSLLFKEVGQSLLASLIPYSLNFR